MGDTGTLTVMEIISSLRQLNVNLTSDQQLLNPEGETIEAIYCLKHCLQLKQEDLAKTSQRGLSYVSAETDMQAASRLGLLFNLNKLMRLVGIEDFSFMDIMRPDAKRTRRILSNICKFSNFQAREQENFRETLQENAQQESLNSQIRNECERAQEELEKVKEKKQREMPRYQQLTENLQQLTENLNAVNLQKQKQLELKEAAEAAFQNAEGSCRTADNDMTQLEQQIERLREKIVKSPNKIVQKLEFLERDVAVEREELTALEREIKMAQFKKDCLNAFLKEFKDNCIEPSEQLKAERVRQGELKAKLARLQEQNLEYERNYNDLLDEISTLNTQREEVEQKLKELEQIQNEREGKRQKTSKELQEEKRQLEEQHTQLKKSLKDIAEMIKAVELKIHNKKEVIAKKAIEVSEQQKQIRRSVEEYQKNIQTIIQNSEAFYNEQL